MATASDSAAKRKTVLNSKTLASVAFIAGLLIGMGIYALAEPAGAMSKSVNSTTTVTSTVASNTAQDIVGAYAAHLQDISSGNLSAINSGYENSATVEIYGGLLGPLIRPVNVSQFHSILEERFYTQNFKILNLTLNMGVADTTATWNSTIVMYGNGAYTPNGSSTTITGVYVASLDLNTTFIHQASNWFISNESWEFITMNACASLNNSACNVS